MKKQKRKSRKASALKVSTPKSDPDIWLTTEEALTQGLEPDLFDAWRKLRDFSRTLPEHRVYASGKAIMFSKKTCFFFVRPHKSFLEVVLFLNEHTKLPEFKSVKAASKVKFAHTFRLVHSDQVEGELTDAIERAYARE